MYTDPKNKKYFKTDSRKNPARDDSKQRDAKPSGEQRQPGYQRDAKPSGEPRQPGYKRDAKPSGEPRQPGYQRDTRPSREIRQPGYQRDTRASSEMHVPARQADFRTDDAAPVQNESEERIPSADRLEGRNPVLEALRAGRTINKLWVAKLDGSRIDPTIARIVSMARERNVLLVEVPRITLDQMSETHNHQGVIAQTASHEYEDLDQIISRAREKGEAPFLVMLDELKDAYNLGSILRIADAAGVHGVIIPKHRSIGLDSLVAKASAGAIEYVPVARVTNLSQTITSLKEDGFWVAGTDAEGTIPYNKADFKGPILIVIGSEGEGMAKNIREKCDFLLSIPMSGNVNSLNAAVAAGIVVFEAQRQRLVEK